MLDCQYSTADQLAAVDGTPYTHNSRGNLVNNGTFTYTYNVANRLVSVVGGADLAYQYNGDGLRVQRSAGGDVTGYTWDLAAGLPQVLVENSSAEGETFYIPRVGYSDGESWTYYLPDGLGSVRQLADEQGDLVQQNDYTPFGAPAGSQGDVSHSHPKGS